MLPEPEGMSAALSQLAPGRARTLWPSAATRCGLTPLALAAALRRRGLLAALAQDGVGAATSLLAAPEAGGKHTALAATWTAAAATQRPVGSSCADSGELCAKTCASACSKADGLDAGAAVCSSKGGCLPANPRLQPPALRSSGKGLSGGAECVGAEVPGASQCHVAGRRSLGSLLLTAAWAAYVLLAALQCGLAGLADDAGGSGGLGGRALLLGAAVALPALLLPPALASRAADAARTRDTAAMLAQLACLTAQHLLFRSQGARWLQTWRGSSLAQPALLLASSLALRLPSAFLVPLLLASLAANAALLASACSPCRAAAGCLPGATAQLCLVGMAAPLLAARLLGLRREA